MKIAWAFIFWFAPFLAAQAVVPPGTILPVSLDTGLDARKAASGQPIRAEIMQDIPGTPIKRRAHVVGHVVQASGPSHGPARLVLRFDAVEQQARRIPIQPHLRAIASFLEVEEAQTPEEGAERGITPEVATTQQIGGEQVYRGGGPVASGITTVGLPTPYGVLGLPRSHPGQPCGGVINDRPQAFWLFSHPCLWRLWPRRHPYRT